MNPLKIQILIASALLAGACILPSCGSANRTIVKTETQTMPQTRSNDSTGMGSMETQKPVTRSNDTTGMGSMHMDKDMMSLPKSHMDSMGKVIATGDFDLDFANMMIMHHERAVDMSEAQLLKGTDPKVRILAQNIILLQNAEIKQLQEIVRYYRRPEITAETPQMHTELRTSMKTMMEKMGQMEMTGNIDKDYVAMMITHHECGVSMAEDETVYGKQTELITMAQKMIVDQKKEIVALKALGL